MLDIVIAYDSSRLLEARARDSDENIQSARASRSPPSAVLDAPDAHRRRKTRRSRALAPPIASNVVARRVIDYTCRMDYPRHAFEVPPPMALAYYKIPYFSKEKQTSPSPRK